MDGHVFSSELNATSSRLPIAKLYRHDTGMCWQAAYSASSGYGAWAETATGPLGVNCAAVKSAAWYLKASSMDGGATYTAADTISTGYMGVTHMIHKVGNGVVVGGEMDGRTLSQWWLNGKPVQGEIYLVSTSNSEETLIASTEANTQLKLQNPSPVDPGSVGGLTGTSAKMVQSQLGSFGSVWSRSASVAVAQSHGLVSQHCPSSTTSAYIAIGCESARETSFGIDLSSMWKDEPSISVQQLDTPSNELQLLLVCPCL